MKIRIFVFLGIINLLFSCNTKNKNALERNEYAKDTLVINPLNSYKVNYSEVFSKIEYIPIPSDSNFLVGEIDKLEVTDNYVILMDKYITNSVFVFYKNGQKRIKIHKQGRGPGEYVALMDVYFDVKQQAIVIHCGIRKKLLFYNLSGEFFKEQSLPYYTTRVIPISNNYAFFCDNTLNESISKDNYAPNILLVSKTNKLLSSSCLFYRGVNKAVVYSSNPDFSYWNDNVASIKPDHSNLIYYITTESIYPAYKLDFGKYSIDSRYWTEAERKDATVEKVDKYCYEHGLCESLNMLEDENYLFFRYKYKKKLHNVIYSKRTSKLINASIFWNDMDQITAFFPKLIKDGKIYCLLIISAKVSHHYGKVSHLQKLGGFVCKCSNII